MDHMASERVCYVHCNFCNTILAVSVPCSSMFAAAVTVRCGHCAILLSVNMASNFQTQCYSSPLPPDLLQLQRQHQQAEGSPDQQGTSKSYISVISLSSSSSSSSSSSPSSNKNASAVAASTLEYCSEHEPPRTPPIRPPEKRQRAPSAYNKFIKEEIQRIKASNPEISHREAFSLAAKNWAHFPRIHFGLNVESQAIPAEGTQPKSPGFY